MRNPPTRALIGFCALAIFWTWPIAAHVSSRVAHDPGDPVLNTWILWWNAQTMPFTSGWWNPLIMWPMPGGMALSEHLAGLSVIATPMQWAGTSALTAYNVSVVLTYALSGWFGYLLGRRLTGSDPAGICGGLAFGFSAYRAGQIAHVQVLSAQWMPLALLALHAYRDTNLPRWLALFGAAWLLQALANGYYMMFLPLLIGLWLLWFVDWRHAPRQGLGIMVAWAVASLPLVPILLKYRAIHHGLGLTRTLSDIRDFSATPLSFFSPAPLLAFWPSGTQANVEQHLFPGLTVVVLAVAGLAITWRATGLRESFASRAPLPFYAATTIAMWALALGPGGQGNGPPSLFHPYTWLLGLPGFEELRVAARFAMLGSLCLAISASLALPLVARSTTRWRTALITMVFVGLVLDGITTAVPMASPPQRVLLPAVPETSPVIELPPNADAVNLGAMYRSTIHRHPIVNGYSGYAPPHYQILLLSLWRGDTSVLRYLARGQPLVIIVDERRYGSGFRDMVAAMPDVQSHGVSGAGSMFVLPAQPQAQRRRLLPGPAIRAHVTDSGKNGLVFDLGEPHAITAITMPLRGRHEDLAERLLIETSDDGHTWRETWRGFTGAFALDAALIDPQVEPVMIPLPAATARFVRVYPTAEWMKGELEIR
jgi:F5/8 type C domain